MSAILSFGDVKSEPVKHVNSSSVPVRDRKQTWGDGGCVDTPTGGLFGGLEAPSRLFAELVVAVAALGTEDG